MSKVVVTVGGAASVLAGLLIVGQEIWDVVVSGIPTEGMAESAVHTTWVLLLVFAVVGMHLRQQHAAGVFGEVAALVALFGTVTLFGLALSEVMFLPVLPEGPSGEPPLAWLAAFFVSFAAYLLGLLLFGVASWRARVLPRRAAALLVVGMLLALALKPVIPGALMVFGVAWVWLGAATMAGGRTAAAEEAAAALART